MDLIKLGKHIIKKITYYKQISLLNIIIIIVCTSCGNSSFNLEQGKLLDSLQTTLELHKIKLTQIDSTELQNALMKFENYQQFIKSNINDTLSKQDAYTVQSFITAGQNIKAFSINKINILSRINLLNSQLQKLSFDVKNNVYQNNQTIAFINNEKLAQIEIGKICTNEYVNYLRNIQQLKNNLFLIEQIILKHNNNELPKIVKSNPSL